MKSNFDKRNPFTVPDGYFEDFASKMVSMTQMSVPSIPWYRKTKSWITAAAILSGLLLGARLLMPQQSEPMLESQLLRATATESYILNQIDDSNLVGYDSDEASGYTE